MLDVTPFDVLQALGKHGVQEAERLAAHSLASVEIETVRILPSITGMPAPASEIIRNNSYLAVRIAASLIIRKACSWPMMAMSMSA